MPASALARRPRGASPVTTGPTGVVVAPFEVRAGCTMRLEILPGPERTGPDDEPAGVRCRVVLAPAEASGGAAGPDSEAAPALSGDLRHVGMSDLIQMLSQARKSARIEVRRSARAGLVVLEDGEVVAAALDEVAGNEALFSMLGFRTGRFEVTFGRYPAARSVEGDVWYLLLEAARRLDEGDGDATDEGEAVDAAPEISSRASTLSPQAARSFRSLRIDLPCDDDGASATTTKMTPHGGS